MWFTWIVQQQHGEDVWTLHQWCHNDVNVTNVTLMLFCFQNTDACVGVSMNAGDVTGAATVALPEPAWHLALVAFGPCGIDKMGLGYDRHQCSLWLGFGYFSGFSTHTPNKRTFFLHGTFKWQGKVLLLKIKRRGWKALQFRSHISVDSPGSVLQVWKSFHLNQRAELHFSFQYNKAGRPNWDALERQSCTIIQHCNHNKPDQNNCDLKKPRFLFRGRTQQIIWRLEHKVKPFKRSPFPWNLMILTWCGPGSKQKHRREWIITITNRDTRILWTTAHLPIMYHLKVELSIKFSSRMVFQWMLSFVMKSSCGWL